MIRHVVMLMTSLILTSCNGKGDSKYVDVLSHYKKDYQKCNAAKFLIGNMNFHYGVKTKYLSIDSSDYTEFVTNYIGTLRAAQVQDSLHVQPVSFNVYDSSLMTSAFLIRNIDDAFDLYRNPIVKKYKEITFYNFLNYLLPYRVGFEELNDWRPYMKSRYGNYLQSFDLAKMSIKEISQVLRYELEGATHLSYHGSSGISQPAINQTVAQILKTKTVFSCEDYAIQSLYILRSLGIPSAYEIIPFFGKFNYGHAQESILFEDGKFYPVINGDTAPFKYQIAKMYRRTFQKQANPMLEVQQKGEDVNNIPAHFNHNDYIDITDERTPVSDIILNKIPNNMHNVAYLCVYNCGEWKPIEWASVRKQSSSTIFPSMGRKILYYAAFIGSDGMHFIKEPFILDTIGKMMPLNGQRKLYKNNAMEIDSYDRHSKVQPNIMYTLFYWDNKSQEWREKDKQKPKSTFLKFENVSNNLLYKVESSEINQIREEVRPFTYKDNKQTWW